jgi:subtilisin family serine protease
MGNSLRLKTLASAVSIALIGSALAMPTHNAFAAGSVAEKSVTSQQDPQLAERKTYIIRFAEDGLMHYQGGVNGLAATVQQSGVKRKVDAHSSSSVAYLDYLATQRTQHVDAIGAVIGRPLVVPHSYAITMNGIASVLSLAEATKVAQMPGVKSVKAAGEFRTTTFRGPEFIGADTIWNGTNVPGGVGTRGQGVVVGIIDTGANSTHPSFADDVTCGVFNAGNHKLLSARDCLTSAAGVCTGTDPEAAAGNGHGVHTASTAAGNTLDSTAVPPPTIPAPFTHMSGVAPCASVRTYKVCATTNCDGAAIDAAIENAITDGVDVINFSISGGTDPWADTDRGFLDAVNADIFVAASAGNTRAATPDPVGLVNHLGPWVTTVAASTHDNNVAGAGSLDITGPGTVPPAIQNISLNPGSGPTLGAPSVGSNVVWNAANPMGCTATGAFPAGFFTGSIALISRGTCSFEEKINNAAAAGATVAIIYNNAAGVINMSVGGATLPAYSILQTEGQAIVAFMSGDSVFADGFDGGAFPPAVQGDFGPAVKQGDVLAGFSLRGPSALTSVTKPDVTGPGVNIYAALDSATTGGYGYLSGTSMSSPHTAGAGALIRAAHPTWTPEEVKSALMLTAFTAGHKEDLTTPWDPDDVGSGRIDLTKAAKAGLVMNETYANFLAADPALAGDPKTLNIPSARNLACNTSCTFPRTFRNTLTTASSWTVTVNAPAGLNVTVSNPAFSFTGNITQTQAQTITATPTVDLTAPTFAEIVFHETGGQAPDAHMYVAIQGTAAAVDPHIIDSGQLDLSVPQTFDGIYVNWISHANCTSTCTGSAYNFNPYDSSGAGVLSFFFTNTTDGGVATGTVFDVLASGATIGPASTFLRNTTSAATANFRAGTNGFLGFKMTCPAGTCYGYAKVTTTSPNGFPMTVNRWWYNDSGVAIVIP